MTTRPESNQYFHIRHTTSHIPEGGAEIRGLFEALGLTDLINHGPQASRKLLEVCRSLCNTTSDDYFDPLGIQGSRVTDDVIPFNSSIIKRGLKVLHLKLSKNSC
jgi:hypothetical protein